MPVEAEIWTLDKCKGGLKDRKRLRSRWTGILQVAGNGSAGRCPFVQDVTTVHDHTSMDPYLV